MNIWGGQLDSLELPGLDFNKTDESQENRERKTSTTFGPSKISIFCALDVFGGAAIAGHTTTTTTTTLVVLREREPSQVYIYIRMNTCVFSLI